MKKNKLGHAVSMQTNDKSNRPSGPRYGRFGLVFFKF